ncbi:MAG: saccharopine dehydrogenase NADP-binding domain-containing protein [Anaerolineae bacterium]|nr:saccharopine dehydrogenase NADP-binding domain-containing protein [Anaerolineae bacterium]
MAWLVYGAYGYTGRLIAAEALRRGHRPTLAGRAPDRLRRLAAELSLDHIVLDLHDATALAGALGDFDLVFNAAGPDLYTALPAARACLAGGAHYLDLAGAVPVYEQLYALDAAARAKGIALLPGAGFDVAATDCLAKYVADRLPGATALDLAIATTGDVSGGSTKTELEIIAAGPSVRRGGALTPVSFAGGIRRVRFPDGAHTVAPAPWGELVAAHRTTGLPDITMSVAYPDAVVPLLRWAGPAIRGLLRVKALRRGLQALIGKVMDGPGAAARRQARAYVWARASEAGGAAVEAWLETIEAYDFTAAVAVRCVERILAGGYAGALAPGAAFGADFVLDVPGTQRYDALDR